MSSSDQPEEALTSNQVDPLIGCVLRNTFRIIGCLDEGGMGRLYRAEHLRLHRPVAVKFMARSLSNNPEASARFRREAEIISQLDHPHIVHVLDFDTTEQGDAYIVMELLQGMPLSKRLLNRPRVTLRETAEVALQIASGLMMAHAAGIVHRDLKPDNVFLLSMSDKRVFVKLLDFGISTGKAAGERLTGQYHMLGTPDYMAPEQAIDSSRTDHRADQWSLACIAYEMITLQPAFQADSVVQLLQRVRSEDPPLLTQYVPDLPIAVQEVVLKGLRKDPNLRYESIAQFAEHLALVANMAIASDAAPVSELSESERAVAEQKSTLVDRRRSETKPPVTADPLEAEGRQDASVSTASRTARLPKRPLEGDPLASATPCTQTPATARQQSKRPSREPNNKLESGRIRRYSKTKIESTPVRRPPEDSAGVPPDESKSAPGSSNARALLEQLKTCIAFGDDESQCLTLARGIIRTARASDTAETRRALSAAAELVRPILLRALGGPERKLLLNQTAPCANDPVMGPEQMFLLSQIAHKMTIDELLDVTPLTAVETLNLLLHFRDQGYVSVQ